MMVLLACSKTVIQEEVVCEVFDYSDVEIPIYYLPTPAPVVILQEIDKEIIVQEIEEEQWCNQKMFAELFPKENYDKTLDVLAKVLYGESKGVYSYSKTNCAAVVWCVLNRVDKGHRGNTPIKCATSKHQFAYHRSFPVQDYLRDLAEDVLGRWLLEKNGEEDVGRVLPAKYIWFSGNGTWNIFRSRYEIRGSKKFTPKKSDIYEEY